MSKSNLPENSIMQSIFKEMQRAKVKHPRWPVHVTAQAGIVVEEAGELMRAALQWKYEAKASGKSEEELKEEVRKEALQTAASAIRFLQILK